MFLTLSIKQQVAIISEKIQEINFSKEYSENDKKEMKSFYRKKLKQIQPNTKI